MMAADEGAAILETNNDGPKIPDVKKTKFDVIIIGAGPAGIACACEARALGYIVDIYEAKEKPSGLTVYGIAPYKITNEEVLKEEQEKNMDRPLERYIATEVSGKVKNV